MAMKKLYAKTSFTSKKPSNASNSSPILAYHHQQHQQLPGSNGMCEFQVAPAPPGELLIRRSQSMHHKMSPPVGGLGGKSEYYSIEELQELDLLDYRHPMYHHYQQQQQQELTRQRYHEHEKLVLQLPKASGPGPIYEAPQQRSHQQQQPQQQQDQMLYVPRDTAADTASSIASSSSTLTSSSPSSSSSLIFSTLRKCVSPSNSSNPSNSPLIPSQPSRTQPSKLGCSMSFSIRTTAATLQTQQTQQQQHQQQQQQQQQHKPHLYSNIHHYLLQQQLQQQQKQHHTLQRRHNSVKDKFIGGITTIFAEQSIIGARASVMVYDDNQKKWVPSGTSSGLSKVQIYHHQQNNTFRVVGRKLQDHEVVINCSILKGLKYNQATATFHQWRDSKYVYGLNFSSQSDAENFARAMHHALDVLSGRVANNPGGQPTNGNGYEEDMGYRTMTSEDAAILRQNNGIGGHTTPSAQTPTSQTNQNNIPQSPPTPQGHHRTSRNSLSAPPAPQPQQQQQQQQQAQQMGQPGSHYGPTGNGPTPNGLPPQVNPQIPPAPQQQQQQPPPQQQQQQFQQQQQQQQQYQQMVQVQAGYAPNQVYQQPHYVLSNSNPNLTVHQYPTQQQAQQQPQAPQPPPLQNGGLYMVGPGHLPSSASANSVVYASQQQMLPQAHPQAPQAPAMPGPGYGGPPVPPPQQQQQQAENPYGQVPMPPPMNPSQQQQQPGQVPLNRMSSQGGGPVGPPAPAPPPPPPSFGGAPGAPPAPPQMFNGAPPPPQPPAPPAPPAMGGGPPPPGGPGAPGPPPPPPPPGLGGAPKKDDPQADLMGSLASQLQQFKLKKNKSTTSAPENSGSSTSSGGSGNYGTIGRSSNGMASMMDEMAKTLARRRAQAEKKDPEPEPEVKQRPWEKSNTLPHKLSGGAGNGSAGSGHGGANGSSGGGAGSNTTNSGGESPRPMRKRFGSASEETILKVNGDGLSLALSNGDLDTLKAEIVREMRLEIQKVKNEIIDAIKSEFNRR